MCTYYLLDLYLTQIDELGGKNDSHFSLGNLNYL